MILTFSASLLFSQNYSSKKNKRIFKSQFSNLNSTLDSVQINSTTLKIIKIIHLDTTINTKNPEFGQLKLKDSVLFFSSSRPDADENINSYISRNYVSKIYFSIKANDKWTATKEFLPEVNLTGTDNADICFTNDHKKFYFSRGEKSSHYHIITSPNYHIYSCILKNNKWQKPQKLGGKVNIEGFTSTQPTVAKLEDGNEILYFVSDRPGGMGKNDVWYTVLLPNGQYTDPVNLGPPVNSPGDDITPYYHQASGILYFSSDGQNGTRGFDIYKSKGFKNTWREPVNIGAPFNSEYDEMYYTVNENDTNGLFTSNRPGTFYSKNDTCCKYDIYEYQTFLKQIPVKIITKKDTSNLLTQNSNLKTQNNNQPINSPLERGERGVSTSQQTTNNSQFSILNSQFPTLILYFDNDYPNPHSAMTKTNQNYINLLKAYINRRNEYVIKYSASPNSQLPTPYSQKEINTFFDDKVVKAETDLKEFSEQLLDKLNKGCNITLEIGGYCSPLYTSHYNYKLSQRRISSFIVYLKQYNNGEFVKYLNPSSKKNGKFSNLNYQLSIISKPEGKYKAPSTVSQNPHDIRSSVYSPSAAAERKIVITPIINSCK